LALVEADYNAHSERLDTIGQQAREFESIGHFNAPQIVKKQQGLQQRFEALLDPLQRRKNKLGESLVGHLLFRDIDDELTWIREKVKRDRLWYELE